MNPFKEMTEEEMMKNRETDHYQEFINGPFVRTVETLTHPLVQQNNYQDTFVDDDQFRFPPWGQNFVRWEVRPRLALTCWVFGYYDLLFSVEV